MNGFECITPPALVLRLVSPESLLTECMVILSHNIGPYLTPLLEYLELFLLTCLLEAPIYWFCTHGFTSGQKIRQILFINLCTHPAVIYIFPLIFSGQPYWKYLAASEFFACFLESVILYAIYRQSALRSFIFGISANLFSWWVGVYIVGFAH